MADGRTPTPLPERCEQGKEQCDRFAVVLVRESPTGNPYRDLNVCEHHAAEMVESGLYFRVRRV